MWPPTPYYIIKIKLVTDHLDKYPESGSLTIARILYRDYPEYFISVENARDLIRYRRGAHGKERLRILKDKRYVKVQPSTEF